MTCSYYVTASRADITTHSRSLNHFTVQILWYQVRSNAQGGTNTNTRHNAPNHFTIQITMSSDLPLTRSAWKARLAALPGSPGQIPAFFFAHGSPFLTVSTSSAVAAQNPHMRAMIEHTGLESPSANFLRDFGPALLAKYQPKGILVFSAHWETEGEQVGRLLTAARMTPATISVAYFQKI